MESIANSKSMLSLNMFQITVEPKPAAVYFKTMRGGPIGAIRNALQQSLSSWVPQGLSFNVDSVLEIVTDARLKDRLTAALRVMEIVESPNFDIFNAARERVEAELMTDDNQKRKNLKLAMRRLRGVQKRVTTLMLNNGIMLGSEKPE